MKFDITTTGKATYDNKPFTFTLREIVAVDKADAIAQAKVESIIVGMRSPRIQRVNINRGEMK